MSEQIKYLSVSKIQSLQMCPEAFRLKYIEKIPEPSSGRFHFGKVIHATIEKALRQVLLGNSLPSMGDMQDSISEIWEALHKEEEERPGFLTWDWSDDSPEEAKKDAYPLVKLIREEVLPAIRPVHVEHGINQSIVGLDGQSFRVYGVIDLFEEGGMITDWKTANGKVSDMAKKQDCQIDGYGRWGHEYTKSEIVQMRKVFLVRNGARPKMEVKKYEVGEPHRKRFEQIAAHAWAVIQGGGYVPNTSIWKCSAKWCSYWNICPFGGSLLEGAF